MGKSLVIVESPAKAKTINKYLGKEYVVKSSIGHIRDLPVGGQASKTDPKERAKAAAATRKMSPEEKEKHRRQKTKEQLFTRMGVNPENNWAAQYQVLPGKEKVVDELKRLAKDADTIYLATDLDREGEAIAWHLRESIGGSEDKYKRVVFNEITKNAIKDAFSAPGSLDIDRVNAQQARRFLDRVVGFMVSPLLWSKVARGLSAGRVQSVAVRLIVEREREIRAFTPEEFWQLFANTQLPGKKDELRLEVVKHAGESYRPTNKADSDRMVALLEGVPISVADREDKPTSSKPSAPFITSTLQQAASTRLGFSVKKTMMLAQRLYEAGYITYMRTDSTNLSQDAITAVRDYIEGNYGDQYLPKSPVQYGSSASAQEAHEAIRPSDVNVSSTQLSNMERDAERLYELIWRRFVACQMTPAKYKSSTITARAGEFELKTKGRILVFDGYTKVLSQSLKKEEDIVLPDVQVGDDLKLLSLDPSQHFTKPAPRYSEAALVKELEKRGIGRPSTYASIISTIQERGYVSMRNKRFYAEKMGDIVTDRLVENFNDLLDYNFTANMEQTLDAIAEGDRNWIETLNSFYAGFTQQLDHAEAGMRPNQAVETDIDCPTCGRKMAIRNGSTGVFLGCTGYNLPPKERCKTTINLISGDEVVDADADDEAESKALRAKKRCPVCDTAMESFLLDEHRKIHICGNNPDCHGYEIEQGEYKIKGYDGPVLECDRCGSEMQLKNGRFGKYFGCMNDECKNTRKLLKNGEPAPPKVDPIPMPELKCQKVDDTYVLRDGASGLFLAASQFPKNRETRAPQVQELIPHKSEIDPKYQYLLSAPTHDPDGNPAIIRFSRKNKEQYVMSEVEGKATGWKAFYRNDKWQVDGQK
ncbi:type I DNA topoisomerase [Gynuella sunshinyii]|uniref:DNA topoisomerase 1 n=1 Tax=Gynuella sunshinyii YC6258 TaxID=1445510 RepID=A0A0C5VYA3_9GAMM|nr:type I DNA topoisomerase [Gynuella sunshinyii]AJQ95364.1 topoisomerase IA [Gynuella sunshinyii YC6258]